MSFYVAGIIKSLKMGSNPYIYCQLILGKDEERIVFSSVWDN